ncbi:MAG TPA: hypothetical protein VGN65_01925 [Casimicrobiaceae bacterium]|jgi:hypothetical protein
MSDFLPPAPVQDNTIPPPIVTHWSRIFYRDAFMGKQNEVDPSDMRSPVGAAAILLCVYVAMYLAVGAIVQVLTPPDASAHARTGNWTELAPDPPTATAGVSGSTPPQEHRDGHAN